MRYLKMVFGLVVVVGMMGCHGVLRDGAGRPGEMGDLLKSNRR